ncbi:MAG TPA: cupredoxin domain-containing protein [Vicinamibacterales bacterium]|jgi:cytochrome c oxidase subunit II|nr:cupredoxin domain-containing protein [Vicinamibacterales bacterium]
MKPTWRTLGVLVGGLGLVLGASLHARAQSASVRPVSSPAEQDQAPNRREFTITARDYRFSPDRIEVGQDDLVKLVVQSQDVAYSLTINQYRVSRRVPAGGSTVVEFRADQAGTFEFYSDMKNDARHGEMKGQLVVRPR